MKRILSGVAVFTLIAAASNAGAQLPTRPIKVGISGGISQPVGDAKDAYKMGFDVGALAELHVPAMPVAVRGEFMYHRFNMQDAAASAFGATSGNSRMLVGTANLIYSLPVPGMVKPYLIGGVGLYNGKSKLEVNGSSSESESSTDVGLNGGAGMEFGLAGLSTFVEARFHSVSTEGARTNFVPVTVGIKF
jgi:opacity protein-like surface antigen